MMLKKEDFVNICEIHGNLERYGSTQSEQNHSSVLSHFNEGNSVQTGLYRDNSSYISPGLKLSQKFMKQWYLNFAGYGAFFSENEGSAATWNAGIAYEW